MGELQVKRLKKGADKIRYLAQLINDIETLETMLNQGAFNSEQMHVGAEQEFCLVDGNWNPSDKALELLEAINDPHFTFELALYNLEINLDPLPSSGQCFSQMHQQLDSYLEKARTAGEKLDVKPLLTGILPTLALKHMELVYMTPIIRYQALNNAVKEIRKEHMEFHIRGVDEVNLHHDSVMYEGCNTSFQAHLQIDPANFQDSYNWAQLIAGPVLAICTNSPLLMGRELWEETRIALFTQSIDTRASTFYLDEEEPRVSFGSQWATGTPADFYKDSIVRFRSLITADFEQVSSEEWSSGRAPKLRALGLHNGTVYKWNRLCYGLNEGTPHLRIEARYLPSGPSTSDEIANMAFWVGLMNGRPASFDNIHEKMDFKNAKANFYNAARYGMATQFFWDGQYVSSQELLLNHLLPMAYNGLRRMKIAVADAEKYLRIVKNRILSKNGSRWMVEGYRELLKKYNRPDALKALTAAIYSRQTNHYEVGAWKHPDPGEAEFLQSTRTAADLMQTKIITAQEDDSAELVFSIMKWKGIHHVPILNEQSELTGLVSWQDIKKEDAENKGILRQVISEIMTRKLITIPESCPVDSAKRIMEDHHIHCLPVVSGKKLLGILTSNDF